jgi:hypothetical protein
MSIRPLLLLALLCWIPGLAAQPSGGAPPQLREWTDWVLHGHEQARCTRLNLADAGADAAQVCAWPARLRLDADAGGARFAQRWSVEARGAVPLPGDYDHWPQAVTADGRAVAVVADASGRPVVWLDAGSVELAGRFLWSQRPESLEVPDSIALVDLQVDGADVFPLQRAGSTVWLGQPASAAREADALSLLVFRRLEDAVPARLRTTLVLQVSGEGREHELGKVLPAGFVPVSIDGSLPARIDDAGALRVQLRPGSHRIELDARATAPLTEVQRPAAVADWPAQEIWSYAAEPRLRVTDASGAPAIDPSQAGVPPDAAALPAYVLDADTTLRIEERSRGLSPQDQNRLRLSRQLWLDFDGGGWTARDRIEGSMVRDWRLDLAAPLVLGRAADGQDQGLLVTNGASPGLTGVELREHSLVLDASARIDDGRSSLPVAGWQQSLDAVNTTLNLPPGWRLYAAFGADSAPTSWLAQWNLLDLFLVSLAALMGYWLLGIGGAALVLGYLLLGYREHGAPVVSVIVVLGLGLFLRLLPASARFARVVSLLRGASVVVLALLALGFAYAQLRLAIYPQLERGDVSRVAYSDSPTLFDRRAVPEALPMAAPPVQDMSALESITVTGSRIQKSTADNWTQQSKANVLQRYASNAVIQAGGGEPDWNWSAHRLSWSGPVLTQQQVDLVLSPPWLTRVLRVLAVALLALLLLRLARSAIGGPRRGPTAAIAAAGLLLCGSVAAQAQEFPPQELLDELRARTLQAPACTPRCGQIASASVSAAGERIRIALEVHAAERIALPLPFAAAQLALAGLRIDGRAVDEVLRRNEGEAWVVIDRGVHRIEMDLVAGTGGRIDLRFPQKPARVEFSGSEWEAAGVRDGALLTDTLELIRQRRGSAGEGSSGGQQFPPFVQVERTLVFDLEWRVETRVTRIAPEQGGVSVVLPLLPGERVTSADFKVSDGRITVPLQAGEDTVAWSSQLDRADLVTLTAPSLAGHAETWRVLASPTWNLRFDGVPAVYPLDPADWQHEFHPLPGEALAIAVVRPDAVAGSTLAIDTVSLQTTLGRRAADHQLMLTLRSTQGGQHAIGLPADAELLSVTVDGQPRNARADAGQIALPLRPGRQTILVAFRTLGELGALARSPEVALGAPSTNVRIGIDLPLDRWLLFARGPTVGPAILYWPALAALLLAAAGLARLRRTPLRLRDWLLLGLGFSTFSWPALLLVVLWLFAIDARARMPMPHTAWLFNLLQLALAGLTVIALLALLSAVPQGLLGMPDMQVDGNGSSASALRWFADRSESALPVASAFSVLIWWYKFAMLAWALWLASALIAWLRWAWTCFARGGWWRTLPRRVVAPAESTPPPPKPGAVPPAP